MSIRVKVIGESPEVIRGVERVDECPDALFVFGEEALQLVFHVSGIGSWHGHRFPVNHEGRTIWGFAFLPGTVIKDQIPIWGDMVRLDLEQAIAFLSNNPVDPVIWDEKKLKEPLIIEPENLVVQLNRLERNNRALVSIDIETTGLDPFADDAKIISVALAQGGSFPNVFSFFLTPDNTQYFINWLEIYNGSFLAHNALFEIVWLARFLGPNIFRFVWHDTLIEAYHLDARISRYDAGCFRYAFAKHMGRLSTLTQYRLGIDIKSLSTINFKQVSEGLFSEESKRDFLIYNALDAYATLLVHEIQVREVNQDVLDMQEANLTWVAYMQYRGLPIDDSRLDIMVRDMTARIQAHENDWIDMKLNPNSALQIKRYFNTQGIVLASTDREALEKIKNPIAEKILDHREISKLLSTYVIPLTKRPVGTNIHPVYRLTGTITGRMSSEKPNIQNWPKRKDHSVRMLVRDTHKIIVACDYKQLEARTLAMYCKDPVLIEKIRSGQDIHMEAVRRLIEAFPGFFVPEEPSPEDIYNFRQTIKSQWTFPLFYGAGILRLLSALGFKFGRDDELTAAERRILHKICELVEAFKEQYRKVWYWHEELKQELEVSGGVRTLTGRFIPGPLRYTELTNYPNQGLGFDLVGMAARKLFERALSENDPEWAPRICIHDDLTFFIGPEKVESFIPEIVKLMTDFSFNFMNVPLEVSVSVGSSWGALKERIAA